MEEDGREILERLYQQYLYSIQMPEPEMGSDLQRQETRRAFMGGIVSIIKELADVSDNDDIDFDGFMDIIWDALIDYWETQQK